jgi:hypothetical protein
LNFARFSNDSPNLIRVIKAGVEKPEWKRLLWIANKDGKMILKWILKTQGVRL